MDANLNLVDPAHLHQVWALVMPGLCVVQRRAKASWIPEDVYASIRAGNSSLYTAHLDGAYVGFVVLTPQMNFDGKVVHIWCAYSTRAGLNLTDRFLPCIEEIALGAGARRITFWSPRRWERHVAKHGFEARQVEFSKELR